MPENAETKNNSYDDIKNGKKQKAFRLFISLTIALFILLFCLNEMSPLEIVQAQTTEPPYIRAWSSMKIDSTSSVDWGDWDGDGDLDLAVGNNNGGSNRIYTNDGFGLTLAWTSVENDNTNDIAWGDWDCF